MLSSQLQDEEEAMPKTELKLRKDKLFILYVYPSLGDSEPVVKRLSVFLYNLHVVGTQKAGFEPRMSLSQVRAPRTAPGSRSTRGRPRVRPPSSLRARAGISGPGCGPPAPSSCAPPREEGARGAPRPRPAPPPPQSPGAPNGRVRNDDATSCFGGPRLRLRLRRSCLSPGADASSPPPPPPPVRTLPRGPGPSHC